MELAIIIILAVVLSVSLYFNWRLWESARYWLEMYSREKRAHTVDNLLSALACVASLALVWLSKPKE